MRTYTDWMSPEEAARRYGRIPGNYLLVDVWGEVYAGRQGGRQNRIRRHLRRHRGQFVAAAFRIDLRDAICVRVAREREAVAHARTHGWSLRNRIEPSVPRTCRQRARRRMRRATL